MTISSIRYKGKGRTWKFCSILFLLLYGVGYLEVTSIHSLFHNPSEETVAHTIKDENDACHQSIYHNLKSEDCKHKAHITALKKCPLCHLAIKTLHLASRVAEGDIVYQASAIGAVLPILYCKNPLLPLPARAPPTA